MSSPKIILKGVNVHNLKDQDLELNSGEMVVFTGVSGSGKSSLAFDTIYVEGQRRYLESLSHQARRSLGELPKPDAREITGIAPTIAIEQKTAVRTPRSTVGTMTGIYDFLRVLYARIGTAHCPVSLEPVELQSLEKIIGQVELFPKEHKLIFLSPLARKKKGEFKDEFQDLLSKGFMRVRIDGEMIDLSESIELDSSKAHDIDVVIDRIKAGDFSRAKEAVNLALEMGGGFFSILDLDTDIETNFSQFAYSEKANISYGPLEPHDFSFNHPKGMCPKCKGLGTSWDFDVEKVIDPEKSIEEDCCSVASSYQTVRYGNIYDNLARLYKFKVKTPWKKLSNEAKQVFLYGIDAKWTKMRFKHPETKNTWIEYVHWKGVLREAEERFSKATSDSYKKKMGSLMKGGTCGACKGSRIQPYPSETRFFGKKIAELTALSLEDLKTFFDSVQLTSIEEHIAGEVVKEIKSRLNFLLEVGLDYLSLDRTSTTLSGGEAQRVRLASQIGAGLVGAIYVLDEPSIGLHARDHHKLIKTLLYLKNQGNTVLIVEHDLDTMMAADTIVDVGPGAGSHGGKILSVGSFEEIKNDPNSLTGSYLSGKLKVGANRKKRKLGSEKIEILGARHHNLQKIDVTIPLGGLVCVTGVSGSGKSSLITDTLYPALANHFHHAELDVGKHKQIKGLESIDKVIHVDQSPIGRTPRSNPATYIKLYDEIRDLFASLPLSQMHGFTASHFSFNVKTGSCSYCSGMGEIKLDMDFMEDVFDTCPQCKGERFDPEILQVKFKDKSIIDILNMDVEHALVLFDSIPSIRKKLELLSKVGLDYLTLGQSSTTLSGGEAQRIKLAKELVRPDSGKTLYILDEPTTGLHFHDVNRLITVLQALVDKGNTVLVIEHNLDLIQCADYLIDIGPGAGIHGGKLMGSGPPEKIAKLKTATGLALNKPHEIDLSEKGVLHEEKELTVIRASQNNLKEVSLKIPRNSMTVFSGPSGSGKSSLAFETIYAEGQRRYTETLSSYARTLVKQLPKPKMERIEGLSPTIALEQKTGGLNPRSTVGTITEVYDFLRLMYAHLGEAFDPETKDPIREISKEFVAHKILSEMEDEKIHVLAPISLKGKESFEETLKEYSKQGYLRIRLNGQYFEVDEKIPFEKHKKNELFLVIDRLIVKKSNETRLFEAIQKSKELAQGNLTIATKEKDFPFNLSFANVRTGKAFSPITAQSFSFNHSAGMCHECQGLGEVYGYSLLEKKTNLKYTIFDLCDRLFKAKGSSESYAMIEEYFSAFDISCEEPIKTFTDEKLKILLKGGKEVSIQTFQKPKKKIHFKWLGLEEVLSSASRMAKKNLKEALFPFMKASPCSFCEGSRLNPLSRNVKINGISLPEFCSFSIVQALDFIKSITYREEKFLEEIFSKTAKYFEFLIQIGLQYLSLNRSAPTLSGGELQRIRLAKQLGSGLTSCLYVLDEPTIGLHPYNNQKLNSALKHLKDLGNTLILVEHDPMTVEACDYLFDFGPEAGVLGGEITAYGTLEEIKKNPHSLTGAYLSGKKTIPLPKKRRKLSFEIEIEKANLHNLKNVSVQIPTKAITCFTGISGSGKSSLLRYLLKPAVEKALQSRSKMDVVEYRGATFKGLKQFDKVITIDQSPIGQTARSDVSTYSEVQPLIRSLLASTQKAVSKGLKPGHFSPNHIRGMCRTCWGLGYKTVELQFLPSVRVSCEACKGNKLNPISLEVTFKGKHFGQILQMTVEEALHFFEAIPKILKKLSTLKAVGLSYLKLGQEIASLSGGESQRLRLSRELSKKDTGKTLYIIDEPTVGLHAEDIRKLLPIFHSLADKKNTLLMIEHNLDVIKCADYLIDLGPDAGPDGGTIVAKGTPEEVSKNPNSKTGAFLKNLL